MGITLVNIFERSLNRLQVKTNHQRRLENGTTEESSTLASYVNKIWTEQEIFEVVYAQLWNVIEHVVVFPAERNGILPVWPLISAIEDLDVPIPVQDFGRFLGVAQATTAGLLNSSQTHLSALLKQVIGGEIAYVADTDYKRLVFRAAGAEVPLQAAASLSRAVAGLSIYIDRFFQPDDVLIIDELEMNAHPQAQVALTEFIAALVNAGVRVVLTTHSPYVVDHLNNLMEASRAPAGQREKLARKFALGTPSSFISPEKVAVHAFQEESPEGEVTVRDVLNRKTGLIDWSTFSRVSEHITNLYSDILRATEGDE
ncbi:MAG TPA: AAA family ATPase [Archangium sp.]|nr:AAA family ATPase [Archangium sp.]